MILDDLEDHYALCFKTHASFGAHHENMNEDRPTISDEDVADIWPDASYIFVADVVSDNIRYKFSVSERSGPSPYISSVRMFRLDVVMKS